MNYVKNIENIIKSKKWIKNDIGVGMVQYSKLFRGDEELILFIISKKSSKGLYIQE